jgi:hypothetical protein
MNETTFSETTTPDTSLTTRSRIKFNLICASKCKKHAVELAKAIRPCNKFTRVSEEFPVSKATHQKEKP